MNRKQLILLLVALAIVGGAGLVLLNQKKESWNVPEARMGDKVLPNFRYNDVAAIHVKGSSDLNVVRTNDSWRVRERSDYPANFHLISDLLIKLKNLKVVQSEMVGPSELSHVELDEPGKGAGSGTLVEFKDAQGKVIEALLLGKRHILESSPSPLKIGSPDGRYILLPGNPKEVLLIPDALNSLEPAPEHWLSKDFFKVEKIKAISLVSTNAANSWKFSRETESSPWVLVDARPDEALNTNQISLTITSLEFPNFVDIASITDPAVTGLDKPMVVTIDTFDHFSYTLKISLKGLDKVYYVTVAVTAEIPTGRIAGKDEKPDEKMKLDKEFQDQTKKLQDKLKQEQMLAPWVYVVNSWLMEPLIRDRSQFLMGKQEPKAEGNAPATAKSDSSSGNPALSNLLIK